MRLLLFTGKGGVGKSTLAAGTAALSAAEGRRTLAISTDTAHSLADAYGLGDRPIGSEPVEVTPGLFLEQVDPQERFEQSWADIQRYLLRVLDTVGIDPVAAEELAVIPGAEEVFALLELRRRAQEGSWDTIVVDCAPTAETLRLLALPEALGWYIRRILPVQRRVVKVLAPVLDRTAGVPMPGDTVFDAIQRLHRELAEVRELLTGPDASVRLVLTPERVVLAEARRSWTTLSLYGYRVDGVVANRVFPDADADPWRAGWVRAQSEVLADVADSFAGLPIWRSVYRTEEPVGVDALAALAGELYASASVDPLAPATTAGPLRIGRDDEAPGQATLRLALPGATAADVDLGRNGDDLVITIGSYRRLVTLPAGLSRMRVAGGRVSEGELQVRFVEAERRAHGAGPGQTEDANEEGTR